MINTNTKIKIALAQTNIVWEDKKQNYIIAEKRIREAVKQNVTAIFFPEMSFTGFSMNTDATKESGNDTVLYMKDLAAKYGIHIGFGWVKDCGNNCEHDFSDRCENHYTVTDNNGDIISDYVKLHPFSYSGEDLKFQGGNALTHFLLGGIPCSTFICYDLRFPEIFQAASHKAHIIVVPANWPARRSVHWTTLLQARAVENQVYIIAINCVGDIGGQHYSGDSCVITPDGSVMTALHEQEGSLYVELTDDVANLREHFPVKQDRREAFYVKLYEEYR